MCALVALTTAATLVAQSMQPYRVAGESARGARVISLVAASGFALPPVADEVRLDLVVPTRDGGMSTLRLEEASVFAPAMRARYASIRTFRGYEVGTGHAVAVTQDALGLYVYVADPAGSWQIEPVGMDRAQLGLTDDLGPAAVAPPLSCGYDAATHARLDKATAPAAPEGAKALDQIQKRVYVMALASTGEFSTRYGGTKESVNAAFARSINVLNAITLTEVAVEFKLHPLNDTLIFLNAALDPYRTPNLGTSMLSENPDAINSRILLSTYDIGHVFTNGCSDVGGVVSGRVCDNFGKARGVTCHYATLERIVRDVMAHEVAHQFAVAHSWNNCPGSDGQRAGGSAFEPGSGSTIMSYQGSCGPANNVQATGNDVYYHVHSLDQFISFSRRGGGSGCADVIPVANNEPIVTIASPGGVTIPRETPFVLEGSATDPDGDELFFVWEQYDLGRAVNLCDQAEDSPLFRSLPPSTAGNVRYFPNLNTVRDGATDCEEQLPRFTRDLNFRLTARDRAPVGGGSVWEQITLGVDAASGPFRVTSQANRGTVYSSGEFVTVTWDVAGTNVAPVSCTQVDILMSVDDGRTFPYVLAENTNNDGSEGVTLPTIETTRARFMVRSEGNVFYSMGPTRFEIVTPTAPGFTFSPSEQTTFLCLPDTATVELFTSSLLGFMGEITLEIDANLPNGVTATLDRTTLTPGEAARLTVDFNGYDATDSLRIVVTASADGVENASRELLFDVVSNNFNDLRLLGPSNGAEGVSELPTFRFNAADAADSFLIEVSPDPNFGFGTFEIVDPNPDSSQLGFLLESNEVYFWRVVPSNRCGRAVDVPINAFATAAASCQSFVNDETVALGPNRRYKVDIPVVVPQSGRASDVNVPLVDLSYSDINDIIVSVRAPSGDSVILHARNCAGSLLRSGYDDISPIPRGSCTPLPNDRAIRRPFSPLSRFEGQEISGEWILSINVVTPSSTGGEFREFEIEFCAKIVSAPPELDLALVPVPLGGFQYLVTEFLAATDPDNGPEDLEYILVDTPSRGHLELYGARLRVGDRWTQAQSQTSGLTYVDDEGQTPGRDSARVVLFDNAGNLIATPRIDFEIDSRHSTDVTAVRELAVTLAPNPTGATSTLQLSSPSAGGEVSVFDLQGRALLRIPVASGQRSIAIDAVGLPVGMYVVSYREAGAQRTVRLVRQ